MSDPLDDSAIRISKVREALSLALHEAEVAGLSDVIRTALVESDQLLAQLNHTQPLPQTRRHDAHLDWSFDDESCTPYCRQVQVRVFYNWRDYDHADSGMADWGADIIDVRVLSVSYFDAAGKIVPLDTHHQQLAEYLLTEQIDELTRCCTVDGYHKGLGQSDPLYSPEPQWLKAANESTQDKPQPEENQPRMSPSQQQRFPDQKRSG